MLFCLFEFTVMLECFKLFCDLTAQDKWRSINILDVVGYIITVIGNVVSIVIIMVVVHLAYSPLHLSDSYIVDHQIIDILVLFPHQIRWVNRSVPNELICLLLLLLLFLQLFQHFIIFSKIVFWQIIRFYLLF